MNKLLAGLILLVSFSALSQIGEVGTLKIYSETLDISKEECQKLMIQKYGRWICKLQAIDLNNEYKLVEQKTRSHKYNFDGCKLILIRKMDRVEIRIGEYDEHIPIEKVNYCLNVAENRGFLKANFLFSAL